MFELITNANVFAPRPLGIQQILVCAEKIVYIGNEIPQLDEALEVKITDLDGARLVPGFIDAHTHLTGGGGEAGGVGWGTVPGRRGSPPAEQQHPVGDELVVSNQCGVDNRVVLL